MKKAATGDLSAFPVHNESSRMIWVLDAQRSLYAAQTDRVTAQAELSRGYIALNKAVGG